MLLLVAIEAPVDQAHHPDPVHSVPAVLGDSNGLAGQ